ncbi:MAG TPA: hypothetical protein VKI44_13535 [Acetobacteraceae bacterium]|nr:hypothetical protein [Acetobacteraceae bacterium]
MSPPLHVSAELRGLARLQRERLGKLATTTVPKITAVMRPLRDTCRSKRPTPWLLETTARKWEEATRDEGRVRFDGPVKTDDGWRIGEWRAVPAKTQNPGWGGDDWEASITIQRVAVLVGKHKVQTTVTAGLNVSAHALCRRVGRGGGSFAHALIDLRDVMPWAQLCRAHGYKDNLLLPTPTGFWRAVFIRLRDVDTEKSEAVPALRTWWGDAMIENRDTCAALAELRRLGPDAIGVGDALRRAVRLLAPPAARQRAA